ncbi:MAG: hypothetical protein ABWX82_06345 [Leifsonia sp.]
MDDDAERERLVQRVYARSSADEPERDYTDPDTGEPVRMRPSAWELMLHDRRVAERRRADAAAIAIARAASAPEATAAAGPARSSARSPLPPGARADEIDEDDASTSSSADPARRRSPGGRMLVTGLAAGILIGAVAVAIVEGIGSVREEPVEAPAAAVGAMLHAVFNSRAYPPADPGERAEVGFHPGTFRRLAGDVLTDDNVGIYAAIRTDGAFCLVSVVDDMQATSQCGTAQEIAERGLRMEKAARSPRDGELIAVTVDWETDGLITWHVDPWPGWETSTPEPSPSG